MPRRVQARCAELPETVCGARGVVVVARDDKYDGAGVLRLQGAGGLTARCVFLAQDVAGRRGGWLTEHLPLGGEVCCDAWLVAPSSPLPYFAARVWREEAGCEVSGGEVGLPHHWVWRVHKDLEILLEPLLREAEERLLGAAMDRPTVFQRLSPPSWEGLEEGEVGEDRRIRVVREVSPELHRSEVVYLSSPSPGHSPHHDTLGRGHMGGWGRAGLEVGQAHAGGWGGSREEACRPGRVVEEYDRGMERYSSGVEGYSRRREEEGYGGSRREGSYGRGRWWEKEETNRRETSPEVSAHLLRQDRDWRPQHQLEAPRTTSPSPSSSRRRRSEDRRGDSRGGWEDCRDSREDSRGRREDGSDKREASRGRKEDSGGRWEDRRDRWEDSRNRGEVCSVRREDSRFRREDSRDRGEGGRFRIKDSKRAALLEDQQDFRTRREKEGKKERYISCKESERKARSSSRTVKIRSTDGGEKRKRSRSSSRTEQKRLRSSRVVVDTRKANSGRLTREVRNPEAEEGKVEKKPTVIDWLVGGKFKEVEEVLAAINEDVDKVERLALEAPKKPEPEVKEERSASSKDAGGTEKDLVSAVFGEVVITTATVQEYVSEDIALLVFKGPRSVALFHRRQVRGFQDPLLPLGTTVTAMVAPLKYQHGALFQDNSVNLRQAVAVYSENPLVAVASIRALFAGEFPTREALEELQLQLEQQFRHLVEGVEEDTRRWPVHAVLNGVYGTLTAQVLHAINDEFGIIAISKKNKTNSYTKPVHRVLFHRDSVVDRKVESISDVVGLQVNLTARSICREFEPKGIRQIQASLPAEDASIPLLQAIEVFVKTDSLNKSTLPSTLGMTYSKILRILSKSHSSFGGGKPNAFYFAANLSDGLDAKLQQFLATPGKPFPYFPMPYYKYLPILDKPVLPVKPGRCLKAIDTSLAPSSPKASPASSSVSDDEVLVVAVIPPLTKHSIQEQALPHNTKDAPEVPLNKTEIPGEENLEEVSGEEKSKEKLNEYVRGCKKKIKLNQKLDKEIKAVQNKITEREMEKDLEDALEEEPKKKDEVKGGEATGLEGEQTSPSKSSVAMHDNLTGPRCPKCDQVCKDQNNLKNHVLSHYYENFYRVTPDMKPFACPTCGKEHRDRISMVRHFAFVHNMLYQLTDITPEILKARVQDKKREGGTGDKCIEKETSEAREEKIEGTDINKGAETFQSSFAKFLQGGGEETHKEKECEEKGDENNPDKDMEEEESEEGLVINFEVKEREKSEEAKLIIDETNGKKPRLKLRSLEELRASMPLPSEDEEDARSKEVDLLMDETRKKRPRVRMRRLEELRQAVLVPPELLAIQGAVPAGEQQALVDQYVAELGREGAVSVPRLVLAAAPALHPATARRLLLLLREVCREALAGLHTGTVKVFNANHNTGVIMRDDTKAGIFVHKEEVREGACLRTSDRVEFSVAWSPGRRREEAAMVCRAGARVRRVGAVVMDLAAMQTVVACGLRRAASLDLAGLTGGQWRLPADILQGARVAPRGVVPMAPKAWTADHDSLLLLGAEVLGITEQHSGQDILERLMVEPDFAPPTSLHPVALATFLGPRLRALRAAVRGRGLDHLRRPGSWGHPPSHQVELLHPVPVRADTCLLLRWETPTPSPASPP